MILTGAMLFMAILPAFSQDLEAGDAQRIIESKNFVFVAQSASPQQLGTRSLTSEYDLTIAGDSLISFLPYFGRAYVAPIDPTKGSLMFTSTKFSYTSEKKKKNWQIAIKPSDNNEVQQLFFDISESGYATLRIIPLNKQSISFNGYIREGKEISKRAF